MAEVYLHNSAHKEFIRDKWVEFASEIIVEDKGLALITFPAEEMHDLHLFAERGLINWEQTETGAYYVKKGKVVCFEKSSKYFAALSSKLSNVTVEQAEIGAYLRSKYQNIMDGNTKIFPVDMINLDYDGNISKSKVPIAEIIQLVFEYQALHQKKFSLFITWPASEEDDDKEYKALLKRTIDDNLGDPRAVIFKEQFEANFENSNNLDYDNLSVIGLSKIIIKSAAHQHYHLNKNEFYIYGEEGRHKMFSILLNFNYEAETAEHTHYSNCVVKSLEKITDLRN